MKKKEETRQAELAEKAAEFKAMQAQAETVRTILKLMIDCFYLVMTFLVSLSVSSSIIL